MNQEEAKGSWTAGKGKIKEETGYTGGDNKLVEGGANRVAGNIQTQDSRVNDAVKKGVVYLLRKKH